MFLNIKFGDDNNLILKRPCGGLWTWFILLDAYDEILDLWWWLRSTTGSYGQPELEATYEETAISLHRGCLGDVSSGRVVGVSTWCITHGWHTRVNTSVGTVYVFFIFNTKPRRMMFSRIYIYYERTLVVPDVVLARWRSGNVFDRPWCFLKEMENLQIYCYCFFKTEIDLHICWIYSLHWFHVKFIVYLSLTEYMGCSHSYCFLFTG